MTRAPTPQRVTELTARERLPWVGEFLGFGGDGFLFAYGASIQDLLRRAAAYVDRILKGTPAGELPIHRPTKLELTLNLRTARALGIELPRAWLVRADR